MQTLDRSAYLATYLLGESEAWTSSRGLIARVMERVRAWESDWRPGFHTGSVMGTGNGAPSSGNESDEMLFDLACSLLEWRSKGGTQEARDKLRRTLVKEQVSDLDYLLGVEDDPDYPGVLNQVRLTVREMVKPDPMPSKSKDQLEGLVDILQSFIGSCSHDFSEQTSEIRKMHVMRCTKCPAAFYTIDGVDGWFALAGG